MSRLARPGWVPCTTTVLETKKVPDHDHSHSHSHDPVRRRHDPSVIGSSGANTSVSNDRHTFTTTFADVSFTLTKGPLDGRLIAVVVPLSDAGPESTITFSVTGFAIVGTGSCATLWMRTRNRSTKVVSFPVGYEGSYLEQMTYVPTAGETEVHLVITLLVERDNNTAEQPALTLEAVDAAIAIRERTVTPATVPS